MWGAMIQDFYLALSFFTRLPVGKNRDFGGHTLAQTAWAFPLVGALTGGLTGCLYFFLLSLGVNNNVSAWLSLGFLMLLTGGLHEDGLADTADGLASGRSREEKLAIMRDSRIGSYGVLALVVITALRADAMAGFGYEMRTIFAFIAAGAASRACLAVLMYNLPAARPDGLFAHAGQPARAETLAACAIGFSALVCAGNLHSIVLSVLILALLCLIIGRMARNQFGGLTGDVLGALQQLAEVAVLITLLR